MIQRPGNSFPDSARTLIGFYELANRHHQRQPLLDEMVTRIRSLCQCQAVGIRLLDASGRVPYESYQGFSQTFYEQESPLILASDACMCLDVIRGGVDTSREEFTERGSFIVNSTSDFLSRVPVEQRGATRNVCNAMGYESVALVPIKGDRNILGLVHVADPRAGRLPLEMITLLESLTAPLAQALGRIGLEDRLRESEERYRSTVHTAGILITSVDAEGILVDCNPRTREVLGYEPDELIGRSMAVLIHPDFMEKARECLAEIISTGEAWEQKYKMVRKDGRVIDVSINSTAIKDGAGVFKQTICLVRDITLEKQSQERLLAYQLQLRSLAEELAIAEEQERRRIAGELHDHIGHALAMAKLKLTSLQTGGDWQGGGAPLQEVTALIEEAIADTRMLTFELGSPVLYELGFRAAVENLAERHQEQYGTRVRTLLNGYPDNLKQQVQVVLFKAVGELLFNVTKHARATEVEIRLDVDAGHLTLEVRDDGVGFDTSLLPFLASKEGGFGLFYIRERLEQIGGEVSIASSTESGTRVKLSVSLDRSTSEQRPRP